MLMVGRRRDMKKTAGLAVGAIGFAILVSELS
jgi:hypothetical protein